MENILIIVVALLFVVTAAAAVVVFFLKKAGIISPAVDPHSENRLNMDGTIPDVTIPEGATPKEEGGEEADEDNSEKTAEEEKQPV